MESSEISAFPIGRSPSFGKLSPQFSDAWAEVSCVSFEGFEEKQDTDSGSYAVSGDKKQEQKSSFF